MIAWIALKPQLDDLLETLKNQPTSGFIALDTEFIRRSTFFAKPCLLQLGYQTIDGFCVALIDLLAISQKHIQTFLMALYQTCAEKKSALVMHAPSEDLQLFDHLGAERTFEIFIDTQIAARYLDYDGQIGLSGLAAGMLNIQAPASQAQSDWHKRPLSWTQIHYAAMDVILIANIYSKFTERLTALDYQKTLEDSLYFHKTEPYYESQKPYPQTQQDIAKIRMPLKARLAHLMNWRESAVRTLDVPRKWHLTNEALMKLASLGLEDEPPTLNAIRQALFYGTKKRPAPKLHSRCQELFALSLDIPDLHDEFYDAWKALPPYPTAQIPVRLSKQAKLPLQELEALANTFCETHGYREAAFMRRAWLKQFMLHYATQRLGLTHQPFLLADGWRQPFFELAENSLAKHWPFHSR